MNIYLSSAAFLNDCTIQMIQQNMIHLQYEDTCISHHAKTKKTMCVLLSKI